MHEFMLIFRKSGIKILIFMVMNLNDVKYLVA